MRRKFLAFLLSISVTLAPIRAHADLGMEFWVYFPLVIAVIAAIQAQQSGNSFSMPERELTKVKLLKPLRDGKDTVTPDEAVKILKNPNGRSLEDRTIVADSVMAMVMANRYWMDRTTAFLMLQAYVREPGYLRATSKYEISEKLEKIFKSHFGQLSWAQSNLIEQFAEVLEFEMAVRNLEIPATDLRTAYLAAYMMALSAVTQKLDPDLREEVLEDVVEYVDAMAPSINKDVTQFLENTDNQLELIQKHKSLRFLSTQFAPAWAVGGLGVFVGMMGSLIALMVATDPVMDAVESLGGDPYLTATGIFVVGIPTIVGTAAAAVYKPIINRVLKPAIDAAAKSVLVTACGNFLRSKQGKANQPNKDAG